METINGTIERINYSQNGFLIARIETGEIVLGNCTDPALGQEYEFRGQWADHPKFGRQFKFEGYRAILPQDLDGIRRYVIRAKWLGPVLARKVVDAFGEDTLAILKNEPEKVAETIPGISPPKAKEISQTLKSQEENEAATVELEAMLGGQHLPKGTIPILIEKYRSDAPAQVRQNPYLLISLRGIGFPTADRVAMAMGFDRESIERRMAVSLHVLKDAAESRGHTCLPHEKFQEKVEALIGLPPGADAVARLEASAAIWRNQEKIALADLAQDEVDVAGIIRMLLHQAQDLSGEKFIDLKGMATDQQEAFRLSMAHPVFILTGAPGTGKTYTLRRIISQFQEWNYRIGLAAPTGKAAKRMSEMTDMPASTIHRLLGPEPYQEGSETKFSFHYGLGQPLPLDLVVIDEFSMVDVPLAASLLRAIRPGTRLLIVGDHYQLPSVGPGAVLRDLLATGVPFYELTEIKRNTGDIVKACHAIKDGWAPVPSSTLDPEAGFNLRHIEESDPERIREIVKDIVTQRMPQRGYDPVWDVQVLSPMNERTPLSCLHFNEMLQGALNINPPEKNTPFRRQDKVLQRKNESIGDEFIVNGDLGEVAHVGDSAIDVDFRYPDRSVSIKRKDHHLVLAYCLTIHKMQGSEAPVIILPLHSSFGGFFNRELVYTGISRARDICITIGQWEALLAASGRVGNARRRTRLVELLKGDPGAAMDHTGEAGASPSGNPIGNKSGSDW